MLLSIVDLVLPSFIVGLSDSIMLHMVSRLKRKRKKRRWTLTSSAELV